MTVTTSPHSLRALVRVPGYLRLCTSSVLWHTSRGGGLFTVSYLLTRLDGAPMVNQIAGALLFAPMLLGGFAAGAISDRFERKRLLICVQVLLIPVEFLMFWVVQSRHVQVWMTFPFMFLLGVGGLANLTVQRPLILDTAGPRLAAPAMTIEATAQSASVMVGSLVGGFLMDNVGLGAGFLGLAVLLCASLVLLSTVPPPRYAAPRSSTAPISVAHQLRAGRALVRRSPRMQAMLLVTIVANLCVFGYQPLVPVVAKYFAGGAAMAGLLAAGPGLGQITGGLALTSRQPRHHFLVFASGTAVALVGLFAFSTAPLFSLAFFALFLSGLGQSGFASMQSLLAIESADGSERGVALGVLGTCIGALPIGTVVIGVLAELLGTRPALATASLAGLVALTSVVARFRHRVAEAPKHGGVADGASAALREGLMGDTNRRSTSVGERAVEEERMTLPRAVSATAHYGAPKLEWPDGARVAAGSTAYMPTATRTAASWSSTSTRG
jgi:predicted MFS family arabinose efflux permease